MGRIIVVVCMLVGVSCSYNDLDIRTYKVPKEKSKTDTVQKTIGREDHSDVKWVTPEGWIAKETTSMRVGSYSAPAPQGYFPADVSIVVLGGQAGGLAANVNRWRGQIGLDQQSEADILKSAKYILKKRPWFHLSNSTTKASIFVSMFEFHGDTIFVKMVGKEAVLKAQKDNFINLVRSIVRKK